MPPGYRRVATRDGSLRQEGPHTAMVPVGSPPTGTISRVHGSLYGDPNTEARPPRAELRFIALQA
jgi:hypothetical protein